MDFIDEIWVNSAGFHRLKSTRLVTCEIPYLAFIKLKSFCWNTCFYNFGWISQVISGWNPLDFTGKICQISGWNLVDFMKSLVIAPTLHSSNWRVFAETLAFIIWVDFTGKIWVKSTRFHGWNPPDFRVKSCGFHEILGHSPHPAFIKLKSFCWNTCFYNFGWVSQVISGWNLLDFRVKSAGFHECELLGDDQV